MSDFYEDTEHGRRLTKRFHVVHRDHTIIAESHHAQNNVRELRKAAYRQRPLPVSKTAMLEQKVADEWDDNSDHDDAERPFQAQNIGALGGRVGLELGEEVPNQGEDDDDKDHAEHPLHQPDIGAQAAFNCLNLRSKVAVQQVDSIIGVVDLGVQIALNRLNLGSEATVHRLNPVFQLQDIGLGGHLRIQRLVQHILDGFRFGLGLALRHPCLTQAAHVFEGVKGNAHAAMLARTGAQRQTAGRGPATLPLTPEGPLPCTPH